MKSLCPGSRLDVLATEKLRAVAAQKSDDSKGRGGEESENTDDPDGGDQAVKPTSCPTTACSASEIEERLRTLLSVDARTWHSRNCLTT